MAAGLFPALGETEEIAGKSADLARGRDVGLGIGV